MDIRRDLPEVKVFNGNFEAALRLFKKKVRASGVYIILKDRRLRPSGAMRRRHKRHMAENRR